MSFSGQAEDFSPGIEENQMLDVHDKNSSNCMSKSLPKESTPSLSKLWYGEAAMHNSVGQGTFTSSDIMRLKT